MALFVRGHRLTDRERNTQDGHSHGDCRRWRSRDPRDHSPGLPVVWFGIGNDVGRHRILGKKFDLARFLSRAVDSIAEYGSANTNRANHT